MPDAELAALDARLSHARSLGPGRRRPRSLGELAREIRGALPPEPARDVVAALAAVARALSTHFPENLFADLDAVAGALAAEAHRSAADLARTAAVLVDLHELYGRSTTIRFRYVHDFLYGFDWARWVAAAPAERAHERPFGPAFLSHSLRRGHELLGLIDRGDPKYGPLPPGASRSPFPFRRDPEAEARILLRLADEGAIPVPAWELEPVAIWDRPFVRMREDAARELGLFVG